MPPLPSSPLLSPSQKYHIPTEYAVFLVDASASARTPCGLTDVEVNLTVTDTKDGTARTYTNPIGTLFTPVRDAPFACP